MSPPEEQRTSTRFRYRCYATLEATNETWAGHLVNLSNKGALLAVIEHHRLKAGQALTVCIEVDQESGEELSLKGIIAHVKEHYIGVRCEPLSNEDALKLSARLNTLKKTFKVR